MGSGAIDPARLVHYVDLAASRCAGDFAEVGCYRGATFKQLIRLAEKHGRTAHAFDSFRGMAEPGPHDVGYPRGMFDVGGVEQFRRMMIQEAGGGSWQLHPGYVPACFDHAPDLRLSFAYLDLDHYEPTRQALAWLWNHVEPGGVIVCDDYMSGKDELASKALDEWMSTTLQARKMIIGGGIVFEGVEILDNDQLAIYR